MSIPKFILCRIKILFFSFYHPVFLILKGILQQFQLLIEPFVSKNIFVVEVNLTEKTDIVHFLSSVSLATSFKRKSEDSHYGRMFHEAYYQLTYYLLLIYVLVLNSRSHALPRYNHFHKTTIAR
jgi:predicted membrane metal-binding protein